jgi:hypothetical protein
MPACSTLGCYGMKQTLLNTGKKIEFIRFRRGKMTYESSAVTLRPDNVALLQHSINLFASDIDSKSIKANRGLSRGRRTLRKSTFATVLQNVASECSVSDAARLRRQTQNFSISTL